MTTLLEGYQNRIPFSGRNTNFIPSPKRPNQNRNPVPYLINTGGRSPGVKRIVTTPFNVEIRNEWSNNYTALYACMFFADAIAHSALWKQNAVEAFSKESVINGYFS